MELEKFAKEAREEARRDADKARGFSDLGGADGMNEALLHAFIGMNLSQLASALAVDLAALRQELIGRVEK